MQKRVDVERSNRTFYAFSDVRVPMARKGNGAKHIPRLWIYTA